MKYIRLKRKKSVLAPWGPWGTEKNFLKIGTEKNFLEK